MESDYMEIDLRDLWNVLWKRKLMITILFVAAVISAYIASNMMTPIYETTTTVLIRDQQSQSTIPFLQGLSDLGKDPVQNYVEILKSRTMAERTAEKLGLNSDPHSPEFGGFKNSISVQPVQGTETIRINVQNEDPDQAKVIANALVQSFIAFSQEMNRTEARSAREFIEEQLGIVEKNLSDAEQKLADFKEQEKIVSPEAETKAILDTITTLETQRGAALVAQGEAEKRITVLEDQLKAQDPTFVSSTTIAKNPLIGQYRSRLTQLEGELAAAREQYTDKHPKVVGFLAEIDDLKAKLNSEVEKIVSAEVRTVNPVYQGLMQEMIHLQVERVAQGSRMEALDGLIAEKEKLFRGLPDKELRLTRLMREATVTGNIYTMLLEKNEETRISEAMKTADVTVIDPAIAPISPIKPRKKLNVAIAGFLALFVGVGLAFLLEYLDQTVKTDEEVSNVLGLPVLGRVPLTGERRAG